MVYYAAIEAPLKPTESFCNTKPPSQTRPFHQLSHLRMGKASSASDVDGSTAYNTVFIDTSLDTHLALIVSDVDTVSDFKKKIMYEHPLCFPDIGEIKIHALKVKRNGYFYHLSNSMLVKSAFDGVKKNWFLCVDASSLVKHSENRLSCNPDSSNLLVCITNNPSADGFDLLPDGPSKRLPILDYSPLRQVQSDRYVNQKVPDADQFGPGDSVREVSKDLEMEFKHISDDHCKTSSYDTNKRSDPEIQEKYDLISERNNMLGTRSEHKEDNSWNGTSDMQCSDYLEGALKIGPVARRKHKIKKKNKDAVDDRDLKDNGASIDASSKAASQQEIIVLQNCSGNSGKEVSNDMKMGTKHISDEPCKSSSSGISKRLDSGIQKKYELCDRTEVPVTHVECKDDKSKDKVVDVQCNNLLGESSQSGPAAKKKRKIEKKNGVGDPSKEKEALICNSSKETSKSENMIPGNSLEDKQKRLDATNDGLSAEPTQDVHSVINGSSSVNRKRKRISSGPYDQVAAAVPSSVKDVREESSKETVGFNHKDSGKEFDAAIVPGRSFHGEKHSESCAISLKEKLSDPVQEVGEGNKVPCSSLNVDMSDVDAGNVESKGDASDVATASGVSRMKSLEKHHSVDAKGHPPLVANVPNNLDKDIRLSRHDNIVSDDHHKLGTDQAHKIEEERELSQNSDREVVMSEKCKPSSQDETEMNNKEVVVSSKLLDGNGVVEPGKFAGKKKKKKSKKVKSSVGGTQVTSGMEHTKGSVSGISSSEPHKAFNSNHSTAEAKKGESILSQTEKNKVSKIKTVNTYLLGADREADEVSGNEVESLQRIQINKTQENPVNKDEKVIKKTRKKRSSTMKNLPDVQTKEQDVGLLTPSADKIREVDAPSKMTGKTKLVETSSKDQLNESNLEPGIEIESFQPQHISGTADSSQVQGRPLQANVDGSLLGADWEADEVSGNEVESLKQTQINKTEENPVNMDEKVRKKTRKIRSSAAKNLPDVQTKEQDVGLKDLTPSTDKIREVDTPSKMTGNLEPGKEAGIEIESFHPQHSSGTADSSQVQGRPLRANVDGSLLMSGCTDEANKIMEVSICESDRINFKDYFVPSQCQHEVVASAEALDDKVTKAKRSDREMKATKNSKKVDVHALGTSPDLQNSLKSNDNQSSGKKSRGGNSSAIQGSLSEDESDKLLPHSDRKSSKVENRVEARPSNDIDKFDSIPEEARRPKVVRASRTSSPAHAYSKELSSSSLGSSADRVHKHQSHLDQNSVMRRAVNKIGEAVNSSKHEKSSSLGTSADRGHKHQSHLDQNSVMRRAVNKIGEAVNSSKHEKSLLATSGNIFKDGNSESSEDDGVVDSDATTRTPSDDSSSSDYSEVENEANLDTPATGSYSTKRKDVGSKNILKSYYSGAKDVTLDTILRSSSRFKKAKLTASRSQLEDTESQPVDFVPDSQANP